MLRLSASTLMVGSTLAAFVIVAVGKFIARRHGLHADLANSIW
jgi:hypothetical protein